MKKRIFALFLAGMLAVLLTACGGESGIETSSASEPQSSVASTEQSSEPFESSDGETPAQPTPTQKEINQTITDPELGYTITLKQAIIDIPFDDPDIWYNGYRTGVCIEVELKNDSEYTGGLFSTDLKLLVNGEPVDTNSAASAVFRLMQMKTILQRCLQRVSCKGRARAAGYFTIMKPVLEKMTWGSGMPGRKQRSP